VSDAPAPAQGDARSVADARRARWQSWLGVQLVRALGTTWRVRWEGADVVRRHQREVGPVVLALWHGELLPLLWAHVGQDIAILVSTHRDGELIARIAMRLGFATVRGSSSRGADRALVGLIRELRAGRTVALTPDGPRGPRHTFAPGALVAAHRSGAAVVPLRAEVSRAWRLGSWDRFVIPKPFATITVHCGVPASVPGDSPRDAATAAPDFQARLDALPPGRDADAE
jgi:lysophospholipid acyltransferase (LPLAT)-like uncharacterized protein